MSHFSIIISHIPIQMARTILYNNSIKNIDIQTQHFDKERTKK